jgi:transposase
MAEADSWKAPLRAALESKSKAELIDIILALTEQVMKLTARVEALEEKLRTNSTNSGKPPSTDGPDVNRPRQPLGSEDDKKKRKPGGQPGHKGHQRALVPPERVDERHDVYPTKCSGCDAPLKGEDVDPLRHQVAEIPEVRAHVIEYLRHALTCTRCGISTRADLPAGVTASPFGTRLTAFTSLLTGCYRLSKRKAVDLLRDAFDLVLSVGVIPSLEARTSEALAAPCQEAHDFLKGQPVVHADETGWREQRKKAWLWVAVTTCVTVFLIRTRRWAEAAKDLLGESFAGLLVSDRWSGYKWVRGKMRQLCWAHLLRDFHKIAERSGWASELGGLLIERTHDLFREWWRLKRGDIQRATFQAYANQVRGSILMLLQEGAVRGDALTKGTCLELLKLERSMWTFVRREGVDPTNNAAERAVRHAVIWRKTSFGTQSKSGSRYVERVLTAVATLRQQKRNVLKYLTAAVEAHILGQPAPSLLPLAVGGA